MSLDVEPKKLFHLGLNAMQENRFAEALKNFETVLAAEPYNLGAIGNAGSCAFTLGDFKKTISMMDRILEKNSHDWKALVMRAQAAEKTGDLELATQLIKEALVVNPKEPKMWSLLVKIHLTQKNLAAAQIEIKSAFENCAPNSELNLLAGLYCRTRKDAAQAIKFFNEVLNQSPKSAEELRIKAVAHLRLDQWNLAFDTCSKPASPPSSLHDGFDSQALVKEYLKSLPNLQFMSSKEFTPRRTVMFSADDVYIERFFTSALKTINESNSDCNIHLHAMLPPGKAPDFLKRLITNRVSISYETYKPSDKTGYTTRRFVRMFQLLKHLKQPILCLDIDSKIVKSLDHFFNNFIQADIGIYRREMETVVNQLRCAGMFYASPTPGALRFLGFFTNYVSYLEKWNNLDWFVDQMALLSADLWSSRMPEIVNVKAIANETMSWTIPQQETLILTLKGGQKNF